MRQQTVYLDYNATTPLDSAVRAAMLPFLGELFGNPSSVHHVGRRTRALLDDARERAALVFGSSPSEIIFTSGGTESNNLAVFGTARLLKPKGRHIVASQIEHHAVLHPCDYLARKEGFDLTYLPVNSEGFVQIEAVAAALRPETILVSVMAANNETGAIQPVARIGELCRNRGVLFHTDAVQWFGKQPFSNIHQFNADLVSICAHKFHGPKGAGALFVRSPLHPDPILFGGSHENERRAGTENVAAIVGLTAALEKFVRTPVFSPSLLQPLNTRLLRLLDQLAPLGCVRRSPATNCLINTISCTVRGCDSISLLASLDLEGICASGGSACSAGSVEPSHVMLALGVAAAEANSLLRFSLGRESSLADIEHLERVLPEVIARIQR